jgi:cell division transport system permease protein
MALDARALLRRLGADRLLSPTSAASAFVATLLGRGAADRSIVRNSRLIPDDEGAGRFLPWVVAVMVFLATLATVGMLVLDQAMRSWQSGLAGNLTVELPAAERAAGSAAPRTDPVLDLLRATAGVREARLVSDEEVAAMLSPWLGPDAALDSLPVPELIDVVIEGGATPDLVALEARLQELVPGARIDDHKLWLEHLLRLGRAVQAVAGLAIALIALAMATVVVFAVRAALAAHDRVVTLLHQMGAKDGFIAAQFQLHALAMGLRGGLIGLAVAALTLFVLSRLALAIELPFLPPVKLTPEMLLVLAAVPLSSGAIAFAAARLTVIARLRRMA